VADVNGGSRWGRHRARGQLLVIGAVVLGTLLVGLALVLNSAIFAENLATREGNAASSGVQTYRSGALAGVGDAIGATNGQGAGDSFATLRDDRYRPQVENLSDQLQKGQSLSGNSVGISTEGSRAGTQLVDEDSSTGLVPRGGTPADWTMAAGVHVRGFELTVDPDDGSSLGNALTGGSVDTLVLTLVPASGPTHEVAIYHDGGARVAVSEVGSSTVRTCEADGDVATLSVTGRPQVDGTYCDALAPVGDATGTYHVRVTEGDRAVGTYRLIVDRRDGTPATASLDEQVDRTNYGTNCSGATYHDSPSDSPYSVPAIYAGTVELRYQDSRAESRTTARVAPAQAGDRLVTPLVTSLSVTDTSGGDTSLTVDWTVEDPNGVLDTVTVDVNDRSDSDGVSDTTDVSGAGESASDSYTYTDPGDGGDTYDITVTVTDGSHSRSRTVRHTADGDDTGCPA